MTPTPVVALNRAVALAEVDGPGVALAAVDELDLDAYGPFHITRADLLARLGRSDEAAAAYDRALTLTANEAERRFLLERRNELARQARPTTHGRAKQRPVARPSAGGWAHAGAPRLVPVLRRPGHLVAPHLAARGVRGGGGVRRHVLASASIPVREVLELGSGGGHNAVHLKDDASR